jgi:hypothetical protein
MNALTAFIRNASRNGTEIQNQGKFFDALSETLLIEELLKAKCKKQLRII